MYQSLKPMSFASDHLKITETLLIGSLNIFDCVWHVEEVMWSIGGAEYHVYAV